MSNGAYFRQQAKRCRRLSRATGNEEVGKSLREMADEYESKADELDGPPHR